MGSVTTITLLANLVVVAVIRRHPRLHKKENVFIVSLAVSDLLMVPVMALAAAEEHAGTWRYGEPLCQVWLALDNMCSFASIVNICSISVVRYIRTKDPFRYHKVVTRRFVVTVISMTWLFAAVGAYPQVHTGHLEWSDELKRLECKTRISREMVIVYCVCTFYVPCLFMIVLYWQLYSLTRRHLRNSRQLRPFGECRRNYKAAVTIGIMIGAFLACWLPMFVVIPARLYHWLQWHWLYETCKWLAYLNSMLDPILYSAMNKTFRESAKTSFRYYMTAASSST